MKLCALGPDGTFTGAAASLWDADSDIRYYPEIQDVKEIIKLFQDQRETTVNRIQKLDDEINQGVVYDL